MFIPYPDFCPSRILDPGSKNSNKREGWKKLVVICTFFVATKITFWANLQRIIELSTQNIVINLSKIWVWDPGSVKNLFRIPDPSPGGKKAPDPGSGSATLQGTIYFGSTTLIALV
jgi:hypothetical protein